jgi:hypothetical protein
MTESPVPRGYVARLITDDELVINLGSRDGVKKDMYFNIIDESARDVPDPITGENLGSIDRIKAQIHIERVSDRGRSGFPGSIGILMGPKPPSGKLTGDTWPEGVKVGDPVKYVTG